MITNFTKTDLKKTKNLGLLILILYLSLFNLFVIKATPEVIFIQFFVLILIYKKLGAKTFLKEWVPFIGLVVLYEFLRGIADDMSPFFNQTLFLIHQWESALINPLPTVFLQNMLLNNVLVLNISLFFYSSFFYYSFLVAFLIWLYKRNLFKEYCKKFLIISYIGLFFYFVFPTAPPWYVQKTQEINIQRPIYHNTIMGSFSKFSIYKYLVYGNPVAAFPSLHTAWTAFTSFFLILKFGRKYLLSLVVPMMVAFSVVLTGEHYLLDIIAGFALGFIGAFSSFSFPNLTHIAQKKEY